MQRLPYKVCKPYYDALGIDFTLNPEQQAVVEQDDRFPLIIGGERGGKSFVSSAIMVPHIELLPDIRPADFYNSDGTLKYNWENRERKPLVPNFAIFGPNYAEPRVEFSYIEEWLRELDNVAIVSKPQEGPWRLVTKTGVVLVTWSTENPSNIRGIDLDGGIAAEAGNMEWESIERIQGRIGAKRGFMIYSGTMEQAKRWYINWAIEGERQNKFGIVKYSIPSWSNRHEFPGGRNDPEILRWENFYTFDVFSTRVMAEPVPPRDRVIRELTSENIKKVKMPRDDDGNIIADIELCIDPGYLPSAYAVLWVASWDTPEGKFWYIFDEIYEQMMTTEQIIQRIKSHTFYKYLKVDGITIDVSAKRHADGNEPAIDMFIKKTKVKSPYYKYWHENALIERIRTTAHAGLIAIHPNCVGLIAEAGLGEEVFPDMHPWKFHTGRDGSILNEKPIDKWNHAFKALGYLLLRRLGIVERMGAKPRSYNRVRSPRSRTTKSYLRKATA